MCSWSCFEHEAFKIFGSISVQSLAQARSQHEPLGFGLVTLQGIVEAPLVSYCSSFPSNQDHRPENSKCLVALSLRPIWILLLHIYLWPCAESFSTCLSISSGQVDSGLAVTVFFVTVFLTHRKCPSGGCFVGQFDSCHTDQSFRQSASIGTKIIDGCHMKKNNARFRLFLHINVTHRGRNIVLWNTEVRSRSNMIILYVISKNPPETLSNFDIWIGIQGFFFIFWRIWLRVPRGVTSRFVRSGGQRLSLLQDFARSARWKRIRCFSWEFPLLSIWNISHEFQMVEVFANLPYPLSKRSPVQLLPAFKAYPMNFPGRNFVPNRCTRPWFFWGECYFDSILLLLQME